MSGGSFDYLCYASDAADLLGKTRSLREMATELGSHEWATQAALDTRALAADLAAFERHVQARMAALADVWRAVEWWRSCDYSEAQAREAAAAYRSPGESSAPVLAELAGEGRDLLRLLTAALERAEAE